MDFSSISSKKLLGQLLRLPLRLIPHGTKMPILQGKLKGKKWIVGASNHGYWLGSYEYKKRIIFEDTIRQGNTVLDIGAYVGFYTLLASILVGPTGKVYAFEPLPRNLEYLKTHLRLNNITNVEVIDAAVSDSFGTAYFKEGSNRSTGRIGDEGEMQVRTVSLDWLIENGEISIPDQIKIDVEGGELDVINGGRLLLERSRPTVFLATHGRVIHRRCCDLLSSLGYSFQAIDGKNLEQSKEILAYWEK
jgi:FkbM family methyltransferase